MPGHSCKIFQALELWRCYFFSGLVFFNSCGASPHEVGAAENHDSFSLLTNLYGTIFCKPTLRSRACLFLANHLTLCALSDRFVFLVNAKINKFRLKQSHKCEVSGFLGEVAENCAVLGYYAASSGNL